MNHLGDKVSALVDGQLPIEATERAHAHLAHCRDCRDAVEAERLMKARLSCLPAPEPGADLLGRLLALGGPSGPLAPRPGHVPGMPRPAEVPLPHPAAEPVGARSGYRWSGSASTGLLTAPAPAVRPVSPRLTRASTRPVSAPRVTHPPDGRPGGRANGPRRIRIAGAVLGALGVVGVGVSGLVLAAPSTPSSVPARAPLDSFVVDRPLQPRGLAPDVSLRLDQLRPSPTPGSTSNGGR